MGQIADRGDLHHACAALERVQVAQQGFHFLTIRRLGLPAHQRRTGAFDDVETFLKEDVQQLAVVMGRVIAGRRLDQIGMACVSLAERTDRFDQFARIVEGLMLLQLFKQMRQAIVAVLQQRSEPVAVAVPAVHQAFVKAFQFMGQIADRLDLGHARATFEGVQIPLQGRQRRGIGRLA